MFRNTDWIIRFKTLEQIILIERNIHLVTIRGMKCHFDIMACKEILILREQVP